MKGMRESRHTTIATLPGRAGREIGGGGGGGGGGEGGEGKEREIGGGRGGGKEGGRGEGEEGVRRVEMERYRKGEVSRTNDVQASVGEVGEYTGERDDDGPTQRRTVVGDVVETEVKPLASSEHTPTSSTPTSTPSSSQSVVRGQATIGVLSEVEELCKRYMRGS